MIFELFFFYYLKIKGLYWFSVVSLATERKGKRIFWMFSRKKKSCLETVLKTISDFGKIVLDMRKRGSFSVEKSLLQGFPLFSGFDLCLLLLSSLVSLDFISRVIIILGNFSLDFSCFDCCEKSIVI